MRLFKRVSLMVMSITFSVLLFNVPARAIEAITPTDPYYGPVFITALQTSNQLDFIELRNETSSPVHLKNWRVDITGKLGVQVVVCSVTLSSWIIGESYVTLAREGVINDSSGNVRTYTPCAAVPDQITKIALIKNDVTQEEVILATTGAFVRKGETKTYRTGAFIKDFVPMVLPNRTVLYAEPWYDPPEETLLQVNEILPNARDCSPAEQSADCGDYVKLFNPTNQSVDLSKFRLRSGYQGQTTSPSNTYNLHGSILPGAFATVARSSDDRALSLTNSGGFIGWRIYKV